MTTEGQQTDQVSSADLISSMESSSSELWNEVLQRLNDVQEGHSRLAQAVDQLGVIVSSALVTEPETEEPRRQPVDEEPATPDSGPLELGHRDPDESPTRTEVRSPAEDVRPPLPAFASLGDVLRREAPQPEPAVEEKAAQTRQTESRQTEETEKPDRREGAASTAPATIGTERPWLVESAVAPPEERLPDAEQPWLSGPAVAEPQTEKVGGSTEFDEPPAAAAWPEPSDAQEAPTGPVPIQSSSRAAPSPSREETKPSEAPWLRGRQASVKSEPEQQIASPDGEVTRPRWGDQDAVAKVDPDAAAAFAPEESHGPLAGMRVLTPERVVDMSPAVVDALLAAEFGEAAARLMDPEALTLDALLGEEFETSDTEERAELGVAEPIEAEFPESVEASFAEPVEAAIPEPVEAAIPEPVEAAIPEPPIREPVEAPPVPTEAPGAKPRSRGESPALGAPLLPPGPEELKLPPPPSQPLPPPPTNLLPPPPKSKGVPGASRPGPLQTPDKPPEVPRATIPLPSAPYVQVSPPPQAVDAPPLRAKQVESRPLPPPPSPQALQGTPGQSRRPGSDLPPLSFDAPAPSEESSLPVEPPAIPPVTQRTGGGEGDAPESGSVGSVESQVPSGLPPLSFDSPVLPDRSKLPEPPTAAHGTKGQLGTSAGGDTGSGGSQPELIEADIPSGLPPLSFHPSGPPAEPTQVEDTVGDELGDPDPIQPTRRSGLGSAASMATEILSAAPEIPAATQEEELAPPPGVPDANIVSQDFTIISKKHKRFRLR